MRLSLLAAGVTILGAAAVTAGWQASRIGVNQGYAPRQPIDFSHRLHAGVNRIPCLYCHAGARTSRHAGIPAASVCMNCHGMLERRTAEIEKMKEAVQLGVPIVW